MKIMVQSTFLLFVRLIQTCYSSLSPFHKCATPSFLWAFAHAMPISIHWLIHTQVSSVERQFIFVHARAQKNVTPMHPVTESFWEICETRKRKARLGKQLAKEQQPRKGSTRVKTVLQHAEAQKGALQGKERKRLLKNNIEKHITDVME